MKYYIWIIALVLTILGQKISASAQNPLNAPADTGLIIPDTLLFKMQNAQAAITEINAANKRGFAIGPIRKGLAELNFNVAPLKTDLQLKQKAIDTKSLQSYNLILKDAQAKLTDWRTALTKYTNELQRMTSEVVSLSGDSLLTVKAADTTGKTLYTKQLTDIKLRLQDAGKVTALNLDTVSRLLADVSAGYFMVTDLQGIINEKMAESGKTAIGRESPYIWAAPKNSTVGESVGELLKASYQGQNKILGYFINSTWDNRILVVLIGLAFFFWVYRNYKAARKPELREKLGEISFEYLRPYPILATIILILNITPLFEINSPSLYIELIQFLLLVAVTFHFWNKLAPDDLKAWIIIFVLYVLLILTNAIVNDVVYMRLWLILMNFVFLYMGTIYYRRLLNAQIADRFIKPVLVVYMIFNSLSVFFNIFGRISLAKVFSITAIIGFTQVIGLAIFIQIVSDALELQMKISSCSNGLFSRLNINKTRTSFKKVLGLVAMTIWLFVFIINLGIADGVFALAGQLLSKPRSFGSVSFTLENILFFVVIVYFSNLLQKYVGVLFGETAVTFGDKTEHRSSKLVLIRLIVVIIGLLLAVTASGIAIDRLTVVLGALSVGIGLGMQNIVNNFVSGIILIFEKPFRIGDYIELADKQGKVKDIGIRSSRMLTPQGSEVVIPNGDLLSGRLVNWTLTNKLIKTEITFKVGIDSDLDAIIKIIQEEVGKSENIIKKLPPEILVNMIAADNIELKVLVWVTSIYAEAGFKSHLFKQLLIRFKEKEVKLM